MTRSWINQRLELADHMQLKKISEKLGSGVLFKFVKVLEDGT